MFVLFLITFILFLTKESIITNWHCSKGIAIVLKILKKNDLLKIATNFGSTFRIYLFIYLRIFIQEKPNKK